MPRTSALVALDRAAPDVTPLPVGGGVRKSKPHRANRRSIMLFALYIILLLGGMYLVGISFASPILPGLVFIAGILCITAAVAVPITIQRADSGVHRSRD
jgi:hypothetical protein